MGPSVFGTTFCRAPLHLLLLLQLLLLLLLLLLIFMASQIQLARQRAAALASDQEAPGAKSARELATAFLAACTAGDCVGAKASLVRGASPDTCDASGATAIAQFVLARGARAHRVRVRPRVRSRNAPLLLRARRACTPECAAQRPAPCCERGARARLST